MCPKSQEKCREIRHKRQEDILQAALRCFAYKGYHACTINDISNEAGISKGLLYNYFTSKEELLSLLFLQFSEEVMQKIDPDGNKIIDDEEAAGFVDRYIEFLDEKRDYCKLFIQISVQPGIMDLMVKGDVGKKAMENQKILAEYFTRLSNGNAEVDMLFFTSLLKGFSLQYIYAPGQISRSQIRGIKDMLLVILNRKYR